MDMDETPTPTVGRCVVCNRILKNPRWVEKGIGPVCYRKKQMQAPLPDNMDPFNPDTKDITMRRDDRSAPIFNIQQVHRHHSPTGMEFGYLGSGPADFALNILALFMPVELDAQEFPANPDIPRKVKCWDGTFVSREAWDLHQGFKQQFLAQMPEDGGTIQGERIEQWLSVMLAATL